MTSAVELPAALQILLVEDEKNIRRFVRAALEAEGFAVCEAEAVKAGLIEAATRKPDLVVLDLGLPDADGVQFVRDLRHWSPMPVLVLSARSAEREKIAALDAGADDYLTKPFAVGELLARVRALLRRSQSRPSALETSTVVFGDVVVDLARRSVLRASVPVHLTPTEYSLLALMLANAGKVLTQRFLLKTIWGPTFVDSGHYLRIYISHLRQKLEQDPAQPRHFITETGVGYRFCL